jgi:hypothetical protein
LLGFALYASIPTWAQTKALSLFVLSFGVILSMYGGGFATVPAYLADMFGTKMVGAIHGRLLTAWSMAGIFGPNIVTFIREYQIAQGIPRAEVYNITMYVLAALLLVGALCNYLVRPVAERHHMTAEQLAEDTPKMASAAAGEAEAAPAGGQLVVVLMAWLVVGIPLLWGISKTLETAAKLFK